MVCVETAFNNILYTACKIFTLRNLLVYLINYRFHQEDYRIQTVLHDLKQSWHKDVNLMIVRDNAWIAKADMTRPDSDLLLNDRLQETAS